MTVTTYANPTTGFTAFMAETGPIWMSGKDKFVNAMGRQNYAELMYLLKGKPLSRVFRGGSTIQERVLFKKSPNSGFYKLGESWDASIPQIGKTLVEYWKFHRVGASWQDETMILNAGASENSSAREASYKNQWTSLYDNMFTDLNDSWSDAAWKKPNKLTMEGVDSSEVKSIPVYINGGADGLATNGGLFVQGSADGGTWTTIHGIDPTAADVDGQYKPYARKYGTATDSAFAAGHPDNVLFALDAAILRTKFDKGEIHSEVFEEPTTVKSSGGFIACSAYGKALLMMLYRNSQDRWTDAWDPYGNPMFAGIPIVYCRGLDTAPLYPISTTGTGTEATATVTGPRFYGINADYLQWLWHEGQYLEKLGPYDSRDMPNRKTMYLRSFVASMCTDRRRHFLLSPGASVTNTLPFAYGTAVANPSAP